MASEMNVLTCRHFSQHFPAALYSRCHLTWKLFWTKRGPQYHVPLVRGSGQPAFNPQRNQLQLFQSLFMIRTCHWVQFLAGNHFRRSKPKKARPRPFQRVPIPYPRPPYPMPKQPDELWKLVSNWRNQPLQHLMTLWGCDPRVVSQGNGPPHSSSGCVSCLAVNMLRSVWEALSH